MRTLLEKFLEINPNECQILNIGAGFDTIAFHLAERKNPNIQIYEVDFPDLVLRKANLIVKSKELYGVLLGDEAPKPSLQSITTDYGYHLNQLHLISSDLHQPQDFIQSLLQAGFQATVPTLIFTECVLVCKNPSPHLLVSLVHRFKS
jgi:[phosphatase 2A protein]-leucine-carboxy methyltransferase